MSSITWLHLSDWHQKGADFDRTVVRDGLIEDICKRADIDPDLDQIDFVVFSGDASFSGQSEEFEAAREHLFDPVLKTLGLGADSLFLVPGNHDLDRNTVAEMLPPALQEPLTDEQAVQHWLTDERRRSRALEPFDAYQAFVSAYTGQSQPAFASVKSMEIAGKTVALLGLNSAWMSARGRDAKGELTDYGYLVIGEPQIHDPLSEMSCHDLRIAVVHHPFNSLNEFDRNRVEERLNANCDLILFGHQHVPSVTTQRGTSGECVQIPAGATFEKRNPADSRYTNAYNFVRLDVGTGSGVVHLRRWGDRQTCWVKDTDTHADGRYEFFLPKCLGKGEDDQPRPKSSAARRPSESNSRIEFAVSRYRELLLESCDIIDLANLPEQDRHLVHRQLELRRLYLPLRARVDIPAREDDVDKALEQLEQRRAATWHRREVWDDGEDQRRVAVGDCLTTNHRLVVLGDPGAGKTTLTRWIATAYLLRLKADPDWQDMPDIKTLPDEDWLPILIRCRDLDTTCLGGSLDDVLKHTLRKAELGEQGASDVQEYLRNKIRSGEALLILDGLDEITDAALRSRFSEQVGRIARAHADLPIITTSRIVGYREMGKKLAGDFEHLTLTDLTPKEKDEFAQRWSMLTERPERRAAAAQELIADIHSNDRIERLTGNPMLLTTMALVKRKVGKLPQRRADLYWEAVQVLLNWRREIDEPLDHREAIPQLEYLAFAMCDRGVQRLREDEVIGLFEQMREEYPSIHAAHIRSPEKFLHLLEARTGILISSGHEKHLGRSLPVYEFRHLTFQEYLAARALVDRRFPNRNPKFNLAQNVAPLAGRISESLRDHESDGEIAVAESWRETLLLCVAICSDDDVDDTLLAILQSQDGDQPRASQARALQASLCLVDEPNASLKTVQKIAQSFAVQTKLAGESEFVGGSFRKAATALTGSRWEITFIEALVAEFFKGGPKQRGNPGDLAGLMFAGTAPIDSAKHLAWLKLRIEELGGTNKHRAAQAALGVMHVAYNGKAKIVPELISALLARLSDTAPMAHAAAWALGWLSSGGRLDGFKHKLKPQWNPQPQEIDNLEQFLN